MLTEDRAFRSTLSITRPANTTVYTALDVVGTTVGSVHEMVAAGRGGGFIQVQSVRLLINVAAVPSGMAGFRLHFYTAAPAAIADNAAFDLVAADRALYVSSLDLPTPVDLGSTLVSTLDYAGSLIKLAANTNSLWVELQTLGGYTPAGNSEVYELRMNSFDAGY